jgi:hypothetical protein
MSGYELLGRLVWRAGKWYLRRRLPSRRAGAAAAIALLGAAAAAVALARRLSG